MVHRVTLQDASKARLLAGSLNLDVLRARLSYVYHTYLEERFPGEPALDVMHMAEDEFENESLSVCLAEGFDIWILLSQLYDMAPDSFPSVRARQLRWMSHRGGPAPLPW